MLIGIDAAEYERVIGKTPKLFDTSLKPGTLDFQGSYIVAARDGFL